MKAPSPFSTASRSILPRSAATMIGTLSSGAPLQLEAAVGRSPASAVRRKSIVSDILLSGFSNGIAVPALDDPVRGGADAEREAAAARRRRRPRPPARAGPGPAASLRRRRFPAAPSPSRRRPGGAARSRPARWSRRTRGPCSRPPRRARRAPRCPARATPVNGTVSPQRCMPTATLVETGCSLPEHPRIECRIGSPPMEQPVSMPDRVAPGHLEARPLGDHRDGRGDGAGDQPLPRVVLALDRPERRPARQRSGQLGLRGRQLELQRLGHVPDRRAGC